MDYDHDMKTVTVNGETIAYMEMGEVGHPIVFLHGIPTSSFLWRKVLPEMSDVGRCYAPDLIGMGASSKPDITYTIEEHYDYIKGWIEALGLTNITFVVHGWGSIIGLHYAAMHPDNTAGLAFYESHIRPVESRDMVSLPVQELVYMLGDEQEAYDRIVKENYLVEHLLPDAMVSNFTAQEMTKYRAPFATLASRKPLLQYFKELPLGIKETPVMALIKHYSEFLKTCPHPKCLLYAMPGLITPIETVVWAEAHFKNMTLCELGHALHYAQESHPGIFSTFLKEWYEHEVLPCFEAAS